MQLYPWKGPFRARVQPPGDKSITHRAVLLSAMTAGDTEIFDPLDSLDTRASVNLVQSLGVELRESTTNRWVLRSPGYDNLKEPDDVVSCANSGTTMRLATGLLAGLNGLVILTGDDSLRERPMARVIDPLRGLGVSITGRGGGRAPMAIRGGPHRGGQVTLAVASAQVKSALLLAGLTASEPLTIEENLPTRDHTERFLQAMGADLSREGTRITVKPGRLEAYPVAVPGDPSSAAFWAALAAIVPDSELVIEHVSLNPGRIGFYQVLQRMGASIEYSVTQPKPDPVGDIVVRWSPLKGTTVSASQVPGLIDELPLVALLGAFAQGTTEVRGAAELRFKESDRIASTVANLNQLGVRIEEFPDGFAIMGKQTLQGGLVDAGGDHRIAMMLAVAAAAGTGAVDLIGTEAIAISYPQFFSDYLSWASV